MPIVLRDKFVEGWWDGYDKAMRKSMLAHSKAWAKMEREANARNKRLAAGKLICDKKQQHNYTSRIWQHEDMPKGLYLNWECSRCGHNYYDYKDKRRF